MGADSGRRWRYRSETEAREKVEVADAGPQAVRCRGRPEAVLFEICDGFYWDGEAAFRNSDGAPAPDGFYIGLLGDDWFLVQGFDGGDLLYGPYATVAEAERVIYIKWQGTASVERDEGLISRGPEDQLH